MKRSWMCFLGLHAFVSVRVSHGGIHVGYSCMKCGRMELRNKVADLRGYW